MQTSSPIYVNATSLVTPLGIHIDENFNRLIEGLSGIQLIQDETYFSSELPLSKIDDELIEQAKLQFNTSTRFDSLLLKCIHELAIKSSIDFSSPDVIILLSTTKGNIELLDKSTNDNRLLLGYSATLIQQKLKNPNTPIVVSNACISGLSAIIIAKRLLSSKKYKHAVVVGCDVLSNFVITGFASFRALSHEICKPFDLNRDGINLGEGAAAMVLSNEIESDITIHGGFISNDGNHISGPSKTGEELSYCIDESLNSSNLTTSDIDFISAHGTATEYNDEMESKAFSLSHLHHSPVFSLKAHYGHTLGASGILEAIISAECLRHKIILQSLGFEQKGVSGDIIINSLLQKKQMRYSLKTASGFGGCNAAIILGYKS